MAIILIGLIVGSFIAADLYTSVHEAAKQTISNGVFINKTIAKVDKVLTGIPDTEENILGNLTRHRAVSNDTRDQEIDLLTQILNQTH